MAESKKKKQTNKDSLKATVELHKHMAKNNQAFEHKVKTLEVYFDKAGIQLYRVRFNKGGKIPGELNCAFTSAGLAQKAIDMYIAVNNKPVYDKLVKVK